MNRFVPWEDVIEYLRKSCPTGWLPDCVECEYEGDLDLCAVQEDYHDLKAKAKPLEKHKTKPRRKS